MPGHLDVEAAEPGHDAEEDVATTTSPPSRSTRPMISRSAGTTGASSRRSASSTSSTRSGWSRRTPDERVGAPRAGHERRPPATTGCRLLTTRGWTTATNRPAAHEGPGDHSQHVGAAGARGTGNEQPPPVHRPAASPRRAGGRRRPRAGCASGASRRSVAVVGRADRHRRGHRRARRTTPGRGRSRQAPPTAGRVAERAATQRRCRSGVAAANCTSRRSCTRTARPGGGRGAGRRPAARRARHPVGRWCRAGRCGRRPRPSGGGAGSARRRRRRRPPPPARRAAPAAGRRPARRAPCAGWASTSCSQPSTTTRTVPGAPRHGRGAAPSAATRRHLAATVHLGAQVPDECGAGARVVRRAWVPTCGRPARSARAPRGVDDVDVQRRGLVRRGRGQRPRRAAPWCARCAVGPRAARSVGCAPGEGRDALEVRLVDEARDDGAPARRAGPAHRVDACGQRRHPGSSAAPATVPRCAARR